MKTGIFYDLPESEYHADPADEPSLSASIAKILWAQSPLHAWYNHPRLNPDFQLDNDKKYSIGSACHALLLGGQKKIVVCDYDSWRKDAAKNERNNAYTAGLIPLLTHEHEEVLQIVETTHAAINQTELAGVFQDGDPEVTMIANDEDGLWSRSRVDWLPKDRKLILDVKITRTSVNPGKFSRFLCLMGYDIQAAHYLDLNYQTGGPEDAKFVFVAQEQLPPYALCLVGCSPSVIEVGREKLKFVKNIWRECLETGLWPGYPKEICWAEVPKWEQQFVMERTLQVMEGDEI